MYYNNVNECNILPELDVSLLLWLLPSRVSEYNISTVLNILIMYFTISTEFAIILFLQNTYNTVIVCPFSIL